MFDEFDEDDGEAYADEVDEESRSESIGLAEEDRGLEELQVEEIGLEVILRELCRVEVDCLLM